MQKISIVMPVHNALPFLSASIGSMLDQSHGDFEFVIRDDGSTDGSREELRRWAKRDGRIRLFESDEKLGPAGSADWIVRQARCSLVARMDADDISHPDRLRRQLEVLVRNPDVVMVGCLFEGIDAAGRVVRVRDRSPLGSPGLAAPFPHGSIMFRRESFELAGGYRRECEFWEDLDLYFRVAAFGRVVVLPEPLYRFRFSSTSTRLTSRQEKVEHAVDLMFECIEAVAAAGDYEQVLASPPPIPRKVRPQAFVSFGSIRLWSGRSPGTLVRMLRRARLAADLASIKIVIWSLWATANPQSLRFALNLVLRLRDRQAGRHFPEGRFYDWGFSAERGRHLPLAGPISRPARAPRVRRRRPA